MVWCSCIKRGSRASRPTVSNAYCSIVYFHRNQKTKRKKSNKTDIRFFFHRNFVRDRIGSQTSCILIYNTLSCHIVYVMYTLHATESVRHFSFSFGLFLFLSFFYLNEFTARAHRLDHATDETGCKVVEEEERQEDDSIEYCGLNEVRTLLLSCQHRTVHTIHVILFLVWACNSCV